MSVVSPDIITSIVNQMSTVDNVEAEQEKKDLKAVS
jgi:hypothetical protein